MAHRTGSTVSRLADRLRDAAARHGCDGPVAIPLAALATGILLLGAPPTLRTTFLHRLSDRAHTRDARAIWRAAAADYPYLSGNLDPLIGWLTSEPPDHQMKALAECFGALTLFDLKGAAESPGVGGDLLGPVYSELRGDRSRQRTGAFYTPPDLSALLAAMTGPRPGDRVFEPACGTGGMVLAAVRSMRERDLDPNSCTWTLNDLDPVAVALASVNMAAHGVRTVHLRCGDALAQQSAADGRDGLSDAWAASHADAT
ncbi:HsdM family class I SAM-dependent methyltransferase [Nakamurella multipartita]|uniref:site-specific DNA-methyltransferase (adenine-specific) n=1 Tax=Nakamurella multipartita (strain ATCC 700099 / DSM 44233 / CIP 104796 / JCM 9543 / NBRC 105858 / Y-104) TaxID=479431 RepID=C8X8L8_NAKMY|nr:N-6 DNA methylase [Nakamurella multipartita]ACV79073.1 Type I restriction-modification system methyltransferase subunit-like protein [Nakamurella multipartita DSM 44233]